MKKKSNLDEMQEKKLLNIEHNACWLGFWGLFIAIYVQIAFGNVGLDRLGGEIIVLLIMAVYICVSCVKNGIWDRNLKPNFKTNLAVSAVTGIGFAAFWFVISYRKYHALAGSLATGVFMFVLVGGAVLVLLSLTTAVYRRREQKLEEEADRDEEQ